MFEISDENKIKLTRGDTAELTITPKNADGTIFDITGATAVFSVKSAYEDTEYTLQIPVVNGKVSFLHDATKAVKPGKYVWDIQITKDSQVVTIGPGTLQLLPDVTVD